MKNFTLTLCLLLVSQIIFAQYQIGLVPRVSPDKAVFQKIGYTDLEITYGSPAVKNRQVWGDLVPYDKVWRAGANNATTVEISSSITINNKVLDSGKYALFIIPKENEKWTIIFNKTHKQWGAFKYNKDEDALRVEVLPKRTDYKTENLNYSIQQTGFKYGSIVLNWNYKEIEIPFETNYLKQFEKEVTARADKQPEYIKWIVYLQGAEHLSDIKSNEDLALTWINKAEIIMNSTSQWNDQFYPRDYIKGHLYWTKAKLLAQHKDFESAISYANKTKTINKTAFYNRKKELIDSLVKTWKEKE